MIRISGPDNKRLLDSFAEKRIALDSNTFAPINKFVPYNLIMSCPLAVQVGDDLKLKTYKDDSNAIILKTKALKMGFNVQIICE